MSTAHTPGPWTISYRHDGGTQIAIDDAPGIDGERDYDLATVTHGDPDELEANARLIAAAPELLDALEKVVATLPHVGGNERSVHGLLTIASAAIAAFNAKKGVV